MQKKSQRQSGCPPKSEKQFRVKQRGGKSIDKRKGETRICSSLEGKELEKKGEKTKFKTSKNRTNLFKKNRTHTIEWRRRIRLLEMDVRGNGVSWQR